MAYLNQFRGHDGKLGFKDMEGIVIPAVYDFREYHRDYILAGRRLSYKKERVFDLYSRYGDFIFGGFNEFEETESHYLFRLNGELYERDITQEGEWPRRYGCFLDESSTSWLVLDKDLKSVKRGEDGKQVRFKKGFVVETEKVKEGHEYVYYFNLDVNILVDEKPALTDAYMLTTDPQKAQAIRLSDGESTDYYDDIRHCYESIFYINKDGLLGIATFNNNVMLLGDYFAFTDAVNGYVFAFRHNGDSSCSVDCIHFGSSRIISIETVIASRSLSDVISELYVGLFKLTPVEGGNRLKAISVCNPELFDEPFASKIATEKEIKLLRKNQREKYWFSNDDF